MKLHRLAALLLLLAPAACGDDSPADDDTSSGTGGSSSTGAGPGATSSTSASASTSASTSSSTGGSGSTGSGAGGGGISPAATIESDDGTARMILEEGALPEGVSVEDITVTALSQDDVLDDFDDSGTFLGAYRFAPDGLQLSIPARFEVDHELPEGALLLTGMMSNQGIESLETAPILDGTEEAAGFSYDVPHFSETVTLAGAQMGTVRVRAGLKETVVGGAASTSVKIQPVLLGEWEPETVWKRGERSFRVKVEWQAPPWSLKGSFISNVNLDPAVAPNPADLTAYDTTEKVLKQRFTCIGAGDIETHYDGEIEVDATITWTPVDGGAEETEERFAKGHVGGGMSTAICALPASDPTGDFVDSISTNDPTYVSAVIDITGYAANKLPVTAEESAALFEGADAVYPCGESAADAFVVCATSSLPMPEGGEIVQVTTTLADGVPVADDGHSFTHSVVLDSDAVAANNWLFRPPFDWDLFQGADRWYQLIFDHLSGQWSVTASQVASDQSISSIPTTARAIVQGASVTWLISADEFASASPTYRTTSFGHDGNFSPSDRGADVSGANPTQALHFIE